MIDFATLPQHPEISMGKGGYLGGSTVIYPGGRWSSGPLNVSDRSNSHKIAVPHDPIAARRKKAEAEEAKATAAAFDAQRLSYLHGILDAFIRKASSFPAAPKKARNALQAQVAKAGSEMSWARMQPEFLQLAEKKRKRHEKKMQVPAGNGASDSTRTINAATRVTTEIREKYQLLLSKKGKLEQELRLTDRELLEIKRHFDTIGVKI